MLQRMREEFGLDGNIVSKMIYGQKDMLMGTPV